MGDNQHIQLHATVVAWAGNGVLVVGGSGSGKSALALQLMAHGCDLVTDDRTDLLRENDQLIASAPQSIQGQIEARGFGILQAPFVKKAVIVCAVDLNQTEQKRLPERRAKEYLGVTLALFHKTDMGVLPFAVLQYLKGATRLPV